VKILYNGTKGSWNQSQLGNLEPVTKIPKFPFPARARHPMFGTSLSLSS